MILVVRYLKKLINPCRSWFSWFRTILDHLNFKNKSSLNRNWVLFELHQKRNLNALKKMKSESCLGYWLSTCQSGLSTGRSTIFLVCQKSEPCFLLYWVLSTGLSTTLCAVDRPINCHTVSWSASFSSFFPPIWLDLLWSLPPLENKTISQHF